MAPLPRPEERTLQAVGARRRERGKPSSDEMVRELRALAGEGSGMVALFDARAIAGERHLMSAWAHLGRARSRGVQRLRDRGAELALFVAGDGQLPRALARVGISASTEEFVLVVEKPRAVPEGLARFGLVEAPDVYPRTPDAAVLDRLGIGEAERRGVPPGSWEGLVLERVALLELEAPHATSVTAKH